MTVIENKWELYIDGIGEHQRVLGFDPCRDCGFSLYQPCARVMAYVEYGGHFCWPLRKMHRAIYRNKRNRRIIETEE